MGLYINPGNEDFRVRKTADYIDKSGLIGLVNRSLGTEYKLSCVSRARRFGKSYAAKMLCAYYCRDCDSSALFDDLEIAGDSTYKTHLNKYNVLYFDVAKLFNGLKSESISVKMEKVMLTDLRRSLNIDVSDGMEFALLDAVESTNSKFITIIDEWDAPVRDAYTSGEEQHDYLEFLRSLFKSDLTDKVFAGAYMTGILPVKKDGSQSAISEFREYTMINPRRFAPYFGFLPGEVQKICEKFHVSFEEMDAWYDGYCMSWQERDEKNHSERKYISIFNPNSVMMAAREHEFDSYWQQTSAPNAIADYINMGYDGLDIAAEKLLAGLEIPISVGGFKNDLMSFETADDVLTMMIHFGYISYDYEKKMGHIPNNEIHLEFAEMIHRVKSENTIKRIAQCDKFLNDIVNGNEEEAARYIETLHDTETSPRFYNNEESLRSIVKLATFTFRDHYLKIEELPAGKGYADMAFIPKKYDENPALLIELKYNDTPDSAIAQIKDRRYDEVFQDYEDEVVIVAITYDKEDTAKKHHCGIAIMK